MRKIFIVTLLSLATVTYGQTQAPIQFYVGAGLNARYFMGSQESFGSNNRFTSYGFGLNAFFGAEIFRFVLFETLVNNTWTTSRFGDNDPNNMTWLGVTFSLFGQFPFYIPNLSNIRLSPLLGFGYDLKLFNQNNSASISSWRGDHDIVRNNDQIWLKMGGAANFNLTNNILLHARLLYNIQLYRRWVADNSDVSQSHHGPNIMLGIKFVF